MHAVAEAARNVVCTGAEPLAVTDCLNFGNPERPAVYYQMARAVDGLAAACAALGTPVVSGNVSLYNETEGQAILPTPVVGMLGLLDDVSRRTGLAWPEGSMICLLAPAAAPPAGGDGGRALLGASTYLATVHGREAGVPPPIDLAAERAVQQAALAAIRGGLARAAHDCSDGGLAVALAEGCIAGDTGGDFDLAALDPAGALRGDVLLFAEQASRICLACRPDALDALAALAAEHGVALTPLGPTGGPTFTLRRDGTVLARTALVAAHGAWAHGLDRAADAS